MRLVQYVCVRVCVFARFPIHALPSNATKKSSAIVLLQGLVAHSIRLGRRTCLVKPIMELISCCTCDGDD